VYLLDWGIAEIVAEGRRDAHGSAIAGTLGYMAPEQARGERETDRRSDIYALGAVLFELLVQKPLHEEAPVTEMLKRIALGVEARPSVRAPEVDVPPELEAVCVKATALDPRDRYQTARDLHEDVERYIEGDRDVILRRTMSHEQAARAAELATRARAGADSASVHSQAMAAVGRALALDPSNREALGTLVELLTVPPPDVPPEAAVEIRAAERSLDRPRSRSGTVAVLAWAAGTAGFAWWVGIHDTLAFAFAMATVLFALAMSVVRRRLPRPDGFAPTYLVVGISVALVGLGIGFNPSLVTPTLAVVFIIGFTLSVDRGRRYLPVVAGCIALALPVVLEWLHVLRFPSCTATISCVRCRAWPDCRTLPRSSRSR
jgi:serine/threonine-protein kinase